MASVNYSIHFLFWQVQIFYFDSHSQPHCRCSLQSLHHNNDNINDNINFIIKIHDFRAFTTGFIAQNTIGNALSPVRGLFPAPISAFLLLSSSLSRLLPLVLLWLLSLLGSATFLASPSVLLSDDKLSPICEVTATAIPLSLDLDLEPLKRILRPSIVST